jgi:hypothetical protein
MAGASPAMTEVESFSDCQISADNFVAKATKL